MSPSARPSFPQPKTAPNLSHAFGGVIRLALYRFAAPSSWWWTGGLMLIVAVLAGTSTNQGDRNDFLSWSTEFYIAFLLPALSFLAGAGAIRDEMKGPAVDYILTRPVPRSVYLFFRYAAQWLATQLSLFLVFAILLGVGFARQIPGLGEDWRPLFVAHVLALTVFLALGFLVGACTGRYVIVGLIYGAVVEVGFGRIPVQVSALSVTHHLRDLLHLVEAKAPVGLAALQTTAILLGFALAMLGLAAVIFSRREMVGAPSSEA